MQGQLHLLLVDCPDSTNLLAWSFTPFTPWPKQPAPDMPVEGEVEDMDLSYVRTVEQTLFI